MSAYVGISGCVSLRGHSTGFKDGDSILNGLGLRLSDVPIRGTCNPTYLQRMAFTYQAIGNWGSQVRESGVRQMKVNRVLGLGSWV